MSKMVVEPQGPAEPVLPDVTNFFKEKTAKVAARETSGSRDKKAAIVATTAEAWNKVPDGVFREYMTEKQPGPEGALALQQAASAGTPEEFAKVMEALWIYKNVCEAPSPLRAFLSNPAEVVPDREAKLRILLEYAPPLPPEKLLHRNLVLLGLESLLVPHNIPVQEPLVNGWLTLCRHDKHNADAENIWEKIEAYVESHPKEPLSEKTMAQICLFMERNPTEADSARCHFLVKTLGHEPLSVHMLEQLSYSMAGVAHREGAPRVKQILDLFEPGEFASAASLVLGHMPVPTPTEPIPGRLQVPGLEEYTLPFVQTFLMMGGTFPKRKELAVLTHFAKLPDAAESTAWLTTLMPTTDTGKKALALAKTQAPDLSADELLAQVVISCKKALHAPVAQKTTAKDQTPVQ